MSKTDALDDDDVVLVLIVDGPPMRDDVESMDDVIEVDDTSATSSITSNDKLTLLAGTSGDGVVAG